MCPHCDVVEVGVPDVLLRRRDDRAHVEAIFDCPSCARQVTQPLSERIVPTLVDAGCRYERYQELTADLAIFETPDAITEDEIEQFVAALNHPSWARCLED